MIVLCFVLFLEIVFLYLLDGSIFGIPKVMDATMVNVSQLVI